MTRVGMGHCHGKRCRETVPALSGQAVAGIDTPRPGHANPQRASLAFAWAFEDRGGTIKESTPVQAVIEKAGKVAGVGTAAGDILAGMVVLCAGSSNVSPLEPFGIVLPTAPVRLEAMVTTPMPPLFDLCMIGHGIARSCRSGTVTWRGSRSRRSSAPASCQTTTASGTRGSRAAMAGSMRKAGSSAAAWCSSLAEIPGAARTRFDQPA